jgi:hypothetical protein
MMLLMKRVPLTAVTLAALYFLLAFNAYACLIPLYGGIQVAQGSDCAMPKEPPVRDACDVFKAIGVQSLSSAQPLTDCHSQVVVGEQISVSILASVQPSCYDFSGSPPFLDRDPLSLTSILRI